MGATTCPLSDCRGWQPFCCDFISLRSAIMFANVATTVSISPSVATLSLAFVGRIASASDDWFSELTEAFGVASCWLAVRPRWSRQTGESSGTDFWISDGRCRLAQEFSSLSRYRCYALAQARINRCACERSQVREAARPTVAVNQAEAILRYISPIVRVALLINDNNTVATRLNRTADERCPSTILNGGSPDYSIATPTFSAFASQLILAFP